MTRRDHPGQDLLVNQAGLRNFGELYHAYAQDQRLLPPVDFLFEFAWFGHNDLVKRSSYGILSRICGPAEKP